jgi:hypothetical protein
MEPTPLVSPADPAMPVIESFLSTHHSKLQAVSLIITEIMIRGDRGEFTGLCVCLAKVATRRSDEV